MSNLTNVIIEYSGVNCEGVQEFGELIKANVEHEAFDLIASEKTVETTEGPAGSYAIAQIALTVKSEALNTCLVQIDAVDDGMVPGAEAALEKVFGDTRVEVVHGDSVISLREQNKYLHNKVQELTRGSAVMTSQMSSIIDMVSTNTQAVMALQDRYMSIQNYLHSYVNVNSLVQTVRKIGEAVDEELLEDYKFHTIH